MGPPEMKVIKKSCTLGLAMAAKQQKMGQAAEPKVDPMGKCSSFHGAGGGNSVKPVKSGPVSSPPADEVKPTPSTPQKNTGKVMQSTPSKTARISNAQQSDAQVSARASRRSNASNGGLTRSSSVKIVEPSPDASTASPGSPPKPRMVTANSIKVSQPEFVEVGGGYKAKKTGTAPKPALGPKNDFFEAGERMEVTKWNRWTQNVDKKTLGAHYHYIVGDLPAAVAEPDINQMEHDTWMSDSLHKKRPEEPAHPRGRDPKPAMTTAFSDRALRMREGKGALTALMANDPAPTEWADHGACSCLVCQPSMARPAGQPSHHVHYNKVPRCNKDHAPSSPHWEPDLSHTFNSNKIGAAVVHPEKADVPVQEEKDFSKNLGRKVKASNPTSPGAGAILPHRSFSEDPRPVAGGYDQERNNVFPLTRAKSRQRWQGSQGEAPNRSGVALILTPRVDDPPAPSRICSLRKAEGEFKHEFSSESHSFADRNNQETFRFADSTKPRGRSLPPASCDPDMAGVASGLTGSHLFNCGNPVTMEGKNQSLGTLSNMRNLSPKTTFRRNPSNDSSRMNSVIDHELVDQAHADLFAYRMQMDEPFAALCAHTRESIGAAQQNASAIKTQRGHARSSNIRDNLCWYE
mmetsp:Transcript_79261/g.205958  ORF Transcript_79261/g.205958 Transcript_79261/m.205958 type:complete len:633 (+) Transcript_79261:55-1953(+)